MSGPVCLEKGSKVNLTKGNPGLKEIVIELGWTAQSRPGQPEYDLDASVIGLGANGKVADTDNFVFFGHQKNSSNSIESVMGDNLTGSTTGDICEAIAIRFAKLPSNIVKLVVPVTIYDARNRKQNFGQVANSFVQIKDPASGNVLVRYEPSEDFSNFTALIIAELYKEGNDWKVHAIGEGVSGEIGEVCDRYGIQH
jgi:tellurium resistance protein TerD